MLYFAACHLLSRVWPWRWTLRPGRGPSWLLVVCAVRHPNRVEVVELSAPPPLHLLVRFALWPFALADWVLSGGPLHWLYGLWRLPDFSAGPPLP